MILTTLSPRPVQAVLDMDAFAQQELSSSNNNNKEKLMTADEALCKFGQPSPQRGQACERAGLPTANTKRKGGVDAYGNVDRGQFVRCKQFYQLVNDEYVKVTECSE